MSFISLVFASEAFPASDRVRAWSDILGHLTLHTEQLPYSRDQPLEGRLVARSSSTGALFALIGSRGQSIRPFPRRQTPGRDSTLLSI